MKILSKNKTKKYMNMIHWLRFRGWFDENSDEKEIYKLLPLEIKKDLLKYFEENNVENTYYWPKETRDFWKIFQPVKIFTRKILDINKEINKIQEDLIKDYSKAKGMDTDNNNRFFNALFL